VLLRCSFVWDRVRHHWTVLKQQSGLICKGWMSNINSGHYWITWFQDSELLFWYLLKVLYCKWGPNLSYVYTVYIQTFLQFVFDVYKIMTILKLSI
jgi:hypothetical protein